MVPEELRIVFLYLLLNIPIQGHALKLLSYPYIIYSIISLDLLASNCVASCWRTLREWSSVWKTFPVKLRNKSEKLVTSSCRVSSDYGDYLNRPRSIEIVRFNVFKTKLNKKKSIKFYKRCDTRRCSCHKAKAIRLCQSQQSVEFSENFDHGQYAWAQTAVH